MDPEKEAANNEPSSSANEAEAKHDAPTADEGENPVKQDSPADALSRTPDELAEEQALAPAAPEVAPANGKKVRKPSKIRTFLKKANVYFLMFVLVVIVAIAITVVYYLNSQKPPIIPTIASQELTEEALRDLANKDASVGDSSQTLTIKGNAVIDGQTLMRGNLNIAGNLQTGGSIQGPTLTISGASNLGDTQINSLQVATNTAIQGNTTMRDLSVTGTSTFNGPMTASQITVSRLVMSGNAVLEIPNHISFTGPTPSRTINNGPLGSGGTASISGSDTAGTINVTTGNSPTAGCFVRIGFHQNYTRSPQVIISPIGSAAGRTQYYVERDQSGFSVCAAAPAPGNQTFAFDYFVAG